MFPCSYFNLETLVFGLASLGASSVENLRLEEEPRLVVKAEVIATTSALLSSSLFAYCTCIRGHPFFIRG